MSVRNERGVVIIGSGITSETLESLKSAIAVVGGSVLDFETACRQLSQAQAETIDLSGYLDRPRLLEEPIDKNKPGKSYDKFVPSPWSHKRR